jgi:hypothetical protein
LDGLSDDERTALKGTLDDLTVDTPATEVAAMTLKLLAKKAGSEGATALRHHHRDRHRRRQAGDFLAPVAGGLARGS